MSNKMAEQLLSFRKFYFIAWGIVLGAFALMLLVFTLAHWLAG